jgi:hypothetical protein
MTVPNQNLSYVIKHYIEVVLDKTYDPDDFRLDQDDETVGPVVTSWDVEKLGAEPSVADVMAYESAWQATLTSSLTLKESGVEVSTINIDADGSTTATIAIEGPADGVVSITVPHLFPISALSVTLDNSGNGSVTIGPSTYRCSSPCQLGFAVGNEVTKNLGVSFVDY